MGKPSTETKTGMRRKKLGKMEKKRISDELYYHS